VHILYLDESGGPNSWNTQKNFVLGGAAVHEGQIYTMSKELDALQEKYWPGISFSIEFHVSPIRHGKGIFREMSRDLRENLIADVYKVIGKQIFPGFIAFATSIDASAVQNANQVTHDCFEEVCQNFNRYLYHQFKRDTPAKGLLVIDRGRDIIYRQLFREFKDSPDVQKYLAGIVDIPYFTACRETRMLQIADFIANAVWRYYEYGEDQALNEIIGRFYRGPRPYLDSGLAHITSDDTCDCYACTYKNK